MKKVISIILLCSLFFSCGSSLIIDDKKYQTYGIINEDDIKDHNIDYDFVWGNLFWSVVLAQTIIAPIYFIGFDIFEPVGKKGGN